jgi:hypothetical protein
VVGTTSGGKKAKETLLRKYGKDHFKKIGKEGGKAHDGKQASKTTKEKHGDDFFSRIATKANIEVIDDKE